MSRRAMLSMITNVGATLMIEESTGAGHATPAGEARYRGYSAEDRLLPFARFFTERTLPAPAEVAVAYAGPPTDPQLIPEFDCLPDDLSPSGYSLVETGYGHTGSGVMWVAVRTVMPRVSAAMWDWWFGWHIAEPARYKLWHPEAHLYVGAAQSRTESGLGDRDKYSATRSMSMSTSASNCSNWPSVFTTRRCWAWKCPMVTRSFPAGWAAAWLRWMWGGWRIRSAPCPAGARCAVGSI